MLRVRIRTFIVGTWATRSKTVTTRAGTRFADLARTHTTDFEGIDLLDPTKVVPEELAPVQVLGTMTVDSQSDELLRRD